MHRVGHQIPCIYQSPNPCLQSHPGLFLRRCAGLDPCHGYGLQEFPVLLAIERVHAGQGFLEFLGTQQQKPAPNLLIVKYQGRP